MDRSHSRILVFVSALVIAGAARSQADEPADARWPEPRQYLCERAATPVLIDGKLDEPAWSAAAWTDDFLDIEGLVRARPRFRTRVKMLWDDTYFFIAAQLDEPHVWATLTKHDSVIFHDPDFEVFIDPDGDNHEYYELEINALNTEWDLFLARPYRDGVKALDAWEIPGLKKAVHVDGTLNDPTDRDRGWSVELAIPWAVLGEHAHRPAPPRDGDSWRVNFSRVEWEVVTEGKTTRKVEGRREDNWVWSPQGAIDMHRPERWGFVQFSSQPAGTGRLRPIEAWSVRERLMRVYAAQKAYHQANKSWASELSKLDLGSRAPEGVEAPALRLTPDGYEATIRIPASGTNPARAWHVRQDSRLWADETRP